jgi:Fucose 4-O-acetylase and related acetyltransferases
MGKTTTRIWFFDNMKAILIFFVVLGHVIGPDRIPFLFQFIYLFHMPLFAFCSGYLAKYNPEKILTDMVYPYVVFQALFLAYDVFYVGGEEVMSFAIPAWIMWYMFAMIVWSLLLPLIKVGMASKRGMIITICVTLLMGIMAGFDKRIGYVLSASRILYFLPFFVIGFCIKSAMTADDFLKAMSKWYIKCITGFLSLGILVWLYFFQNKVNKRWLYGSYSYASEGYSFTIRMLIYLCTFIISIFVISIIPRRQMFFSYIGKVCIQIYLLHAFVIKILEKNMVLNRITGNAPLLILVSVVISIIIVFVFSLSIWGKMLKPLFSFPFKRAAHEKG